MYFYRISFTFPLENHSYNIISASSSSSSSSSSTLTYTEKLPLQLCPTGYFTCESGAMTCIYNAFKCDCSKDCDDGSDETEGYAGCSNVEQCLLENGAGNLIGWVFIITY